MKIRLIYLTILLSLFSSPAMGDLLVDDMQLLGKGTAHYLRFIKVYDASLYTKEAVHDQDILSGDISKCLFLHYAVSVGRDDFIKAADTVLARQFTAEERSGVQQEIDSLHKAYVDVADGDIYSLCYDRSTGRTTLSLNSKELATIDSGQFAKIYFSIWLGETDPLDESLRDSLLARM